METLFLLLGLLVVLATLSFLFSLSETAIIGLNKIRLRHLIAKGVRHAQSIQRLVTGLDRFIAAILIGNNFVNIAFSAIVTAIFVQVLGANLGVLVATFSSTLFILVVCEITPKIIASKYSEKIALVVSPFMERLIWLWGPVIPLFTGVSTLLLKLLRIAPVKRNPLITEEEIRLMIEVGKEEGVLSDEERRMLHRIFEFGDTRVATVMVPKEHIVAVKNSATPEELLNIFVEEGHARLPVYQDSIETIVGIIYARDLLYLLRDKGLFLLQDIIHPVCSVAPQLRVNELLRRFQTEKIQIAVVVDEQKKTLGVVTLEDLIEEIVGELEEAHHGHPKKKH